MQPSNLTERDPRVDPKPGDIVKLFDKEFHVLTAGHGKVGFDTSKFRFVPFNAFRIDMWRQKMENAEVIHRAE